MRKTKRPDVPAANWLMADSEIDSCSAPDPLQSIVTAARRERQRSGDDPLLKMFEERSSQVSSAEVTEEIKRRLTPAIANEGEFAGVYVAPSFTGDVPEDRRVRLVVLGPTHPHSPGTLDDQSVRRCEVFLNNRGAGPRLYKNTLVFLAPDRARLEELQGITHTYLTWRSIAGDAKSLQMDTGQRSVAAQRCREADAQVLTSARDCYRWLLVPGQSEADTEVEWHEIGIDDGIPAAAALHELQTAGLLVTEIFGLAPLRERIGQNATPDEIARECARRLYLPRLRDPDVLARSTRVAARQQTGRKSVTRPTEGTHFFASFPLNVGSLNEDMETIHLAVLQHLADGTTNVRIELRVEADVEDKKGIGQTLADNCRRLACPTFGWEVSE